MREALLYRSLENGAVQCYLCHHACHIASGGRGRCWIRQNQKGLLLTDADGQQVHQHVDPIEKKPLYHFYPGSQAFSLGVPGCNFSCQWCQNWKLSQLDSRHAPPLEKGVSSADIVRATTTAACRSIAYTYTEPTIFFEYSEEIACLARQEDVSNVYVSNGYMSAEMLEQACLWLDAANIDLKTFRDGTYRQYTGGRLQPVLDNLKRIHRYGIWLEVTTLVIPGVNDDPDELQDIARFIALELGCDTPWHISRFYPQYQMTGVPPTPEKILYRAAEIGRKAGLNHVYIGNLGVAAETTCPGCQQVVIRRDQFGVNNRLDNRGCCPDCGKTIAGVGVATGGRS